MALCGLQTLGVSKDYTDSVHVAATERVAAGGKNPGDLKKIFGFFRPRYTVFNRIMVVLRVLLVYYCARVRAAPRGTGMRVLRNSIRRVRAR